MRAAVYATLLCLGCSITTFAQGAAPDEDTSATPTKTFFEARTGESLNSPHIGIIHYLEFFQIRKRWIYPDIGYVDFAHGNYREFFIGGGRTLIDNKIATWDQELLYVQATGPAAASARYLAALVDAPCSFHSEVHQRNGLFRVFSAERFRPYTPRP